MINYLKVASLSKTLKIDKFNCEKVTSAIYHLKNHNLEHSEIMRQCYSNDF